MTRRTVRLRKKTTVRRRAEPGGDSGDAADDRARAADASRRAGRVTATAARFLAREQKERKE